MIRTFSSNSAKSLVRRWLRRLKAIRGKIGEKVLSQLTIVVHAVRDRREGTLNGSMRLQRGKDLILEFLEAYGNATIAEVAALINGLYAWFVC